MREGGSAEPEGLGRPGPSGKCLGASRQATWSPRNPGPRLGRTGSRHHLLLSVKPGGQQWRCPGGSGPPTAEPGPALPARPPSPLWGWQVNFLTRFRARHQRTGPREGAGELLPRTPLCPHGERPLTLQGCDTQQSPTRSAGKERVLCGEKFPAATQHPQSFPPFRQESPVQTRHSDPVDWTDRGPPLLPGPVSLLWQQEEGALTLQPRGQLPGHPGVEWPRVARGAPSSSTSVLCIRRLMGWGGPGRDPSH